VRGFFGVKGADAGVCVRAAHDFAMQRPRQVEIHAVDIVARDFGTPIETGNCLADRVKIAHDSSPAAAA
jgi:hypothetical protein